ncbi:MAG: GntR family transcriptional regulator [Fidelibacterota bacterium]|nr:MAG: GntR family transcriptional regulator [Candidatus Neomarinimicrobiota bacterium]
MIIDKDSPVPQYFQLQTWLVEQIEQGVFKPHDKIPTEHELCRLTGLARATVRQAIGNLVNMGYLTRKQRLGTYVSDQEIDFEKRTIIGILVPDIRTGYAPELARGAEDEAAINRHSLILCNTDDLHLKAEHHANRLIENSVSGVIFIPTAASDQKNRQIIQRFRRRNIPIVLADRTLPGVDSDYVTTDNFDGAYRLTEYLIKNGHRKIAITISSLFSTERQRLEGYKQALTDHGIPIDPSLIIADSGPFVKERYFQHARKLLKQRKAFTAVFAGHDRIALLFYSAAQELGISIPDDLSLVGYDDLPFTTISLTTMHQPIYEIGQESLRLILARIRGDVSEPQQVVLKSHLVERSSVKALA